MTMILGGTGVLPIAAKVAIRRNLPTAKEFFGKYKAQYEAFVNYMVDPSNGMRQDFIDTDFEQTGMTAEKIRDREEKPIRDYVKKLLGRIVFLHFLQKKGWLGVPAGKNWGDGDRDLEAWCKTLADNGYNGFLGQEITDGKYFDDPRAADRQNMEHYERVFV